jgi:GNAT superfamily N-acetyltransferase
VSNIQIRPVQTARELRQFLTFPWRIYHNDPLWVPPLLPERRKQIDPKRGAFFKRGEAEFFIAWRDKKPVGAICAAEDKATNAQRHTNDCMFGFFEYIEDYLVAETLLDYVREWGKRRGLSTLYGPFNLDYKDGFGVLIEGRDRPPALLCGHTPPYYKDFMERYGFHPARGQSLALEISNVLDTPVLDTPAMQRLFRIAERARKHSRVTIRNADFKRWDEEVENIYLLFNASLAHLPDFIPWQREAVEAILASFRNIADPELILFAEVEGKVVGFFPGIPNLNEVLIHVNGLRYPWDYLKLLWHMRRKPESLTIKSLNVLPEYWGTPVSILLFAEMAKRAVEKGYKWADLSLTSDDNPNTPVLAERMGARVYKRYEVYRLPI